MIRPELLAPAGDMEKLVMAVEYGADAVYLAGEAFGMRASAGNFSPEELERAVAYCHGRGVRVHVACNTMPRNGELSGLPEFLEKAERLGADALIAADPGVLRLAREYAPHVPIHVSTQANVINYESARVWYGLGAKRVILAREMSLSEIAELRAKTPPELELEAFVHGSMCVSWSGRCLLSACMTGRDANRGACAQPCRYQYALMEETRPGEYYPVFEDGGGTYIFNSMDLCMIDHVARLAETGVCSLKIEGRGKSAYYAAVVTQAYRMAVDAAAEGRLLSPVWRAELDKVSHRPYHTGFYFGGEARQHTADSRYIREWDVAAVVTACDGEGNAEVSQRNRFQTGDRLELVGPGVEPVSFEAGELFGEDGERIGAAPHPQMTARLRLPVPAPKYSLLRRPVSGGY